MLLFILLKAPIAKIKKQSAQQYNLRFERLPKVQTKHNTMYCTIIIILKEHCSYIFFILHLIIKNLLGKFISMNVK